MPLDLYSEPYSLTGSVGENVKRLLGVPAADPLQVLIREALQNIADAARLNRGPEILIRLRHLSTDQLEFLRSCVFVQLPQEGGSRQAFEAFLHSPNPLVLEICDFHTVGLGGPTRADEVPAGNACTDFVDFLLNVGSPRDTAGGGGTYGFGKTAFYRVSRCSAIMVDTLPADPHGCDRRLMACHLGRSFTRIHGSIERRFTGRHWWGRRDGAPGIQPLIGEQAVDFARRIGFPDRSGGRTGTSIMVLDFECPGGSLEDENRGNGAQDELTVTGYRIVEAVLWNFWPRMMRSTHEIRRFSVRVEVNGTDLNVPSPEAIPPLNLFCEAMDRIRAGKIDRLIQCQRPLQTLGHLAIVRGHRNIRYPLVRDNSLFPDRVHHVALMRPVELVVKYLEGPPCPDEDQEWAGVFRVIENEEVERAFAESEPPAHDDWCPASLINRRQRTFVNVALRELKTQTAGLVLPAPPQEPAPYGNELPLAGIAERLGQVLEGVTGDGAGPSPPPPRPGARPRPRSGVISRPEFTRLEEYAGRVVAVFQVELSTGTSSHQRMLEAIPAVLIDGKPEAVDPQLATITRVLGFRRPGEMRLLQTGPALDLARISGRVEILVEMPPDAAVTLQIRVQDGLPK